MNRLVFFVLAIFTGLQLGACSCIGESTVKGSLKSSDLVVIGKVISGVEVPFVDSEFSFTFHRMHFQVVVTRNFKGGKENDTLTVITGMGHGDCGYQFSVDKSYIIYGYKTEGRDIFETDICTRTRLDSDSEEIATLAKVTRWRRSLAH